MTTGIGSNDLHDLDDLNDLDGLNDLYHIRFYFVDRPSSRAQINTLTLPV